MFQHVPVQFTGISPLILHNGQLADPLNPHSKALKAIVSKRKKTDQDHEDIAHLEFIGSLYLNDKNQIVLPGLDIEACLINGAKKNKLGQDFKCGVMVEHDAILVYDGPKDPEKLWREKRFVSRVGAVVNNSRVMRTRPIFNSWSLECVVSYDDEVVNLSSVQDALVKAGRFVGLCDWRPRHGRFEVGFVEKA